VTVIRRRHAFEGQTLSVIHSIKRRGVLLALVILPNGSRSLIPAAWTDWRGNCQARHSSLPTRFLGNGTSHTNRQLGVARYDDQDVRPLRVLVLLMLAAADLDPALALQPGVDLATVGLDRGHGVPRRAANMRTDQSNFQAYNNPTT
jgi:hypothetical protein